MPTEPEPVTLSEVVRRAVEVCDDGTSEGLDDLLVRFEDADEPITAVEDVEERLDEALGPQDADEDEAPLTMARAVVIHSVSFTSLPAVGFSRVAKPQVLGVGEQEAADVAWGGTGAVAFGRGPGRCWCSPAPGSLRGGG